MPARHGHRAYTLAAVAALVGAAGILLFVLKGSGVAVQPPPALVHATEIKKIAPEISGRLARFSVTAGQTVRKGENLVELANPELVASLRWRKRNWAKLGRRAIGFTPAFAKSRSARWLARLK